jgi:hypothetical protein
MKLLVSGEGPSDIGACNNAQGVCMDSAFLPGPMTIWLKRLLETLLQYDILTVPEAVVCVSEKALAVEAKLASGRMQRLRGKNKPPETSWYFSNAMQLGLMAKKLMGLDTGPLMAVLFRDADGTRSAPGQLWQTKWDSMTNGFQAAEFDFGVPMLPKPKSEVWLLCAGQMGRHSHAGLESISGNDDAPKSAKKQWDAMIGSPQTAAQEAEWCADHPTDWQNLLSMPSFKAFYERFDHVAKAILQPGRAVV